MSLMARWLSRARLDRHPSPHIHTMARHAAPPPNPIFPTITRAPSNILRAFQRGKHQRVVLAGACARVHAPPESASFSSLHAKFSCFRAYHPPCAENFLSPHFFFEDAHGRVDGHCPSRRGEEPALGAFVSGARSSFFFFLGVLSGKRVFSRGAILDNW